MVMHLLKSPLLASTFSDPRCRYRETVSWYRKVHVRQRDLTGITLPHDLQGSMEITTKRAFEIRKLDKPDRCIRRSKANAFPKVISPIRNQDGLLLGLRGWGCGGHELPAKYCASRNNGA